ncbi:cadherin repeat domain-containing protein [Sphingobium baderi]|nr:cadherin repeat domain-containing protein [Sphingobium baderi]
MTRLPTTHGMAKAHAGGASAKPAVKVDGAPSVLSPEVPAAKFVPGGKIATTAELIKAAAKGDVGHYVKHAGDEEGDKSSAMQPEEHAAYAPAQSVAMVDAGAAQVAGMYAAAVAQADAGQGGSSDDDGGISAPLIIGGILLAGGGIALAADGGGNGGGSKENHAPTFTSGTTGTVAENAAVSTVVYDANATDSDNDTLTYTLGGADAAAFEINSSSGEVKLKASADYEAKASYSITVTATDNGNPAKSATQNVTISVTNVNEAPAITSGATATVADNDPAGTVVYTTVATDPDANDTLTYALSGDDANLFEVSAAGVVTLKAAANYEASADHSYNFTVTVTDAGGLTHSQAVAVTVENAVDAFAGGLDHGSFGNTFTIDAANGNDPANVLDVNFRFDETPAESDVRIIHFGANDYINFVGTDPDDYNFQADGTDLVITYLPADGDLSTITLVDVLEPGAVVNDAASADAALDAALGAGNYFVGTSEEVTVNLDTITGPQNAAGKAATFTDDGNVESHAVIQNFRSDDVIAFTHAGDGHDVLFANDFDDANDLRIDFFDANGNQSAIILDNVLNGDVVYDFASASLALGRSDFITFA